MKEMEYNIEILQFAKAPVFYEFSSLILSMCFNFMLCQNTTPSFHGDSHSSFFL